MKQESLIGRTIAGKYAIEALVGEGAMGSIYRARQLALGATLALKVLHTKHAGEPTFAARFLREAQAASRVDHPNSMRVIDFGQEPDGLLYMAMEYVDGKTLAKILEEESPLPVARIVDIASQVLAALAVAHDLGVVHRDLKPENIMILERQDDEGRTQDVVKVCDFGVAKLLDGSASGPSVTAEGVVIGTPEYMSPEQARGEALDARSDLYAMGVLLFQLMTGKVPFDSPSAFGTALMHVNDEPTRPRLLNPRVDSGLEKICLKAMRKRPEERYGSARELRAELRALLGRDEEAKAARPGLVAQIDARPRRSGVAVAALVLASTALACAYLYRREPAVAVRAREPLHDATVSTGVVPAPPREISLKVSAEPAVTEGKEPKARVHAVQRTRARRTKARGAAPPIVVGEEALPPPSAVPPVANEAAAVNVDPAPDPADLPLPVFPIPPSEDAPK